MEADPPPPASALMEELVEEVLLRFPPVDPASLVRAALVCRRWRRIVTGPRFLRRYRNLHLHRGGSPSPPMLGFLASAGAGTRFVPTSTFRPAPLFGGWRALDARHGRALLRRDTGHDAPVDCELAVWDPATGRRTDLPRLPWSPHYPYSWNAAVLCSASTAAACDHLDCSGGGGGHFLVVVVGTNHEEIFAHVYSSETGTWSAPASARHPDDNVEFAPSALAGNALYFAFQTGAAALEFDLRTREMAVVRLPPPRFDWQRVVLAARDDGRLGLATAGKSTIYLWAREAQRPGDGNWVQTRAIELDTLLPAGAISAFPDVVSFVDGVGVVFVRTGDGLFTIDLKSLQVTKLSRDTAFSSIFPYISFHTPALEVASTGEGPSSGA
ncbi:unnamed protein product [Miscanthus lutarioriparius]|uniref:F-box domain-containing protein n=1 Tax=Miscanthus lutarioriparius TaxID=422564 RepID=A0A811NGE9_9POAL|nr:unnamed protein product [Miscanthus lutarioriparius]